MTSNNRGLEWPQRVPKGGTVKRSVPLLRAALVRLCALLVILSISIGGAELVLRWVLSSPTWFGERLRNPKLYADWYSSDDFWKLYYAWDGRYKPPEHTHPLLGWTSGFSPTSFVHNHSSQIGERRPVLLFGDSFAECVPQEDCFQDMLNTDATFSQHFFLLNYGVGGYGLDQIYLLMDKATQQYDNPIVLLSFMTYDIDRSILSVRTGQKPYFMLSGDSLQLSGVPIDPYPAHFFATHPVQLSSYLLAFLQQLPQLLSLPAVSDVPRFRSYKKQLNEKILQTAVQTLRSRDIPFWLIVFHTENTLLEDDWRDVWLKGFLEQEEIPHVWSKDVLSEHVAARGVEALIAPQHAHPTSLYNQIIAREIWTFVQSVQPTSEVCLQQEG